ncbi:MAG: serine hydrolase domain-containing protein [Bacteroidota bacterium]
MKITFLRSVFAGILALSIVSGNGQDHNAQRDAVDLLFNTYSAATPGVYVLVTSGDSLVINKGYGMEHIKKNIPMTSTSLLDIGSIAKPITAYGIYLLSKNKQLSLNDRIIKYLPDLPKVMEDIEIQHLLHHTSGLRDWPGFLSLSGKSLSAKIDLPLIYSYVKKQERLNFEPGEAFLYSNTGYNLLALIIASVTKESFPSWIKKHVFLPLGMENARCYSGKEKIAQDYFKTADGFKTLATNLQAYGSSSVVLTPTDMLQWLRFLQDSASHGTALYEMLRQNGVVTDGSKVPYGLGVDITNYKNYMTLGHGGAWAGFRAHFLIVPELDMSVALLSNTNSFIALDECHKVLDLFLPVQSSESPENDTIVDTAANTTLISDIASLSGIYKRGPGKYIAIEERNNQPHIAVSGGNFYPMELQDDLSFWIPAYKASIRFVKNKEGIIARYKGLSCSKMPPSRPMSDALKASLCGTYYSSELDAKCSVAMVDNRLVFETANTIKVPLTHAYNLEFTGNRFWIEVVEFIGKNEEITGLEVTELRSRKQYFRKM